MTGPCNFRGSFESSDLLLRFRSGLEHLAVMVKVSHVYKRPWKGSRTRVCVCARMCACVRGGTIQKSCLVFYPLHIFYSPRLFLFKSFSSSQILPVKTTGEKARGRNGGQQNLSEDKGPLRGPSSLLQNAPRDEDERSKKKKKRLFTF